MIETLIPPAKANFKAFNFIFLLLNKLIIDLLLFVRKNPLGSEAAGIKFEPMIPQCGGWSKQFTTTSSEATLRR
jgi:hypothetical protein